MNDDELAKAVSTWPMNYFPMKGREETVNKDEGVVEDTLLADVRAETERRAVMRTITLPEGTWEDIADELYGEGNDMSMRAARYSVDDAHKERLLAYAKAVWSMADALRDPNEDEEKEIDGL